ncbi:hypothetical protein Tco_1198684 [Tanacetum coccineum]
MSSDSNVEYLRANLNIKGISNSRRTSLSNVDYMLYPSLLRTVTDWKGKTSLRATEVAEEYRGCIFLMAEENIPAIDQDTMAEEKLI